MMKWIGSASLIVVGGMTALGVVTVADGIRAQAAGSESSALPRWEYKVVSAMDVLDRAGQQPLKDDGLPKSSGVFALAHALSAGILARLERTLNELGGEGWELFSVADGAYVFKRRQP